MILIDRICVSLTFVLLTGVATKTVHGQAVDVTPSFRAAMTSMGQEIEKYIDAQQGPTAMIAVGTFVGPGPSTSNAGVRIGMALREYFEKSSRVADSGAFNVTGEFRGEKLDGKFVTVIEAAIKDRLGTQLHRLRKKIITDEEEGIAFFGPSSLDLTSSNGSVLTNTGKTKTDAIVNSIVSPRVHMTGNILRPSERSPYGIEILLKTSEGYQAMPIDNDGQMAKASIGEHQVYAVRLHNDSRQPIGVRLTIDGVNIFAMSSNPAYSGRDTTMAMCPCASTTIKGWHLNDQVSAEFEVAKFGETAAAQFGAFEKMGTITARFFGAVAKSPLPCAPCGQLRSLGTKLGANTKMNYGSLDVQFTNLLASVSARYVQSEPPDDLPPQ